MVPVNSGGVLTIGGGEGTGADGGRGSDGQGVRPASDGTYTVYGNLTLPCDVTIPDDATVVIPSGANLTVPKDVTLTNNGTIRKEDGGSFINDGTVTGQQPADDRYSIDYEAETITIAEGFSLYATQSGGDAIFTNTAGNNTVSLTSYIQSTEQKLYLQAPATGEGEQPDDRREITIPARPQASVVNAAIDYAGEKVNFPPDVTETTLEYALTLLDPNWRDVPSGAALSEMGWNGTEIYLYFRAGATDSVFASEATQSPLIVPAQPAPPNAPTVEDKTDGSNTIIAAYGVQYQLGKDGERKSGTDGSLTFDNLTAETQYAVYARKPATDSQFASGEVSDVVTTKYSPAEPPEMTCEVTADSITLSYDAPWQYQTASGGWVSVEGAKTFTDLEAAAEHTFTVRVAESETAEASKVATVTVWTAYATPAGVQGGVSQISGVTADMEYSADGGKTWVACQDGSVTGHPAGEYLVRHMGSGSIPASSSVTVTVTQSAPPYVPPTPSCPDWDDVTGDIADAVDGGRVVVDMDGETVLPGEVLEAIAGCDVTLVLEMGDGVAWEIWGGDVPEGTSFSDAGEVSEWALGAVSWAVADGVLHGHDGLLEPVRALTCAEAAALVTNLAARG